MNRWILALTVAIFCAVGSGAAAELRLGMIGLDTSHVISFARLLNDPENPQHVPGGRVVAAYKGGSDDIEMSYSRIDGFTQQLEEDFGVLIVPTIEELCELVDAILLTSVDGRPHLAQARPVFEAGLPMFIDKPMAGTLADVLEIFRLSEAHEVPVFSSSAYRFYKTLTELKQQDVGAIRGAISFGPAHLEPTHPDLFWYGVHPTEALFTIMGTGLKTVVRTATEDTDVVTGVWADGRVGTLRGLRNQATPHRVIVFGETAVAEQQPGENNYVPLVQAMIRFFQTGEPPFDPQETIEMFAFMEAADESKRQGGVPVEIDAVIEKARAVHR